MDGTNMDLLDVASKPDRIYADAFSQLPLIANRGVISSYPIKFLLTIDMECGVERIYCASAKLNVLLLRYI